MVEFDNEDEQSSKLTAMQKANLRHISKRLLEIADTVFGEPCDPKIATHLKMAADLADEQERLGKYYTYADGHVMAEEPSYKFLEQDDTITEHNKVPPKKLPESKFADNEIHKWLDGLSED